jgi:hypothetical protein
MKSLLTYPVIATTAIILHSPFALGACGDGFTQKPLPTLTLDTAATLVSKSVQFKVSIPAAEFNDRLKGAPLAQLLPGTKKLPAVVATRNLSESGFGSPGGPRVICLADDSTALEEATEDTKGERFRYKVWQYSTAAARPIEYATGEFALQRIDDRSTLVTWTYAFKLRDDTFPGSFGNPGRWLFKQTFVERDYAEMMGVSAAAMSRYFVEK